MRKLPQSQNEICMKISVAYLVSFNVIFEKQFVKNQLNHKKHEDLLCQKAVTETK